MAKGITVKIKEPHRHKNKTGVTDGMEGALVRVKIDDSLTTIAFIQDVEVCK